MFRNSGFYFIGLLILVAAGFWESYFSKLLQEIDGYIHFHAISMSLWMAMLISQAFLIRFKRRHLHKFIGRFSYGLVPVLTLSIVLLAHSQITLQEYGVSSSRRYILFLQLSLLFVFISAYVLAIIYRHAPNLHARYMICTSLTLIDPAVARIPLNLPPLPFGYQVFTYSIIFLILIVLIIVERKQKAGREVFPIMLVLFAIILILNLTWTDSLIWQNFTVWFANLPLT